MASGSNDDIYFYDPSLAAAALFAVFYLFPAAYHAFALTIAPGRGKFHRACHFTPLLVGAFLEVAGYAVRCASVKKQSNIPLYAVSATLIVIAPVFVCASLYLLMDRLVWTGDNQKEGENPVKFLGLKIRHRWLPRIFVTLDIISCLTQASGSGIASSGNWEGSGKDTGTGVLIGGLVLQVVTFGAFLIIVGSFHLRSNNSVKIADEGTLKLLKGIYISGAFILIRCIYRVIEFALGINAYLFSHEWPLYVLEAVPMLIAISVLAWYHPGRFLSLKRSAPSQQPTHHRRSSHSANC